MIIRYAPELIFEEDQNIAYGIHIASVLKQVQPEDDETNEDDQEQ